MAKAAFSSLSWWMRSSLLRLAVSHRMHGVGAERPSLLCARNHPPDTVPGGHRYLAGLFALAHDPSTEVRKPVCTGLVQLLHLQPERLGPHMQSIVEYMLESTQVTPASHVIPILMQYISEHPCWKPHRKFRHAGYPQNTFTRHLGQLLGVDQCKVLLDLEMGTPCTECDRSSYAYAHHIPPDRSRYTAQSGVLVQTKHSTCNVASHHTSLAEKRWTLED